jgi:type I restriction enzyme S subunit
MPSVRKSDIATIEIPLPPIPQQKQTAAKIEKRFAQIKLIQRSINNAVRQADMLGRSIFKRAFEGKLKGNRSG